MKKAIIIVVVVLIVGAGVYYSLFRKKPVEYETTKVKKGNISQSISASGKIQTDQEVTLQFQTSGKLAWINVKEGDPVQQWQTLAGLDTQELEKKLKKELNDYLNERWDFEQAREDYDVFPGLLHTYTLTNEIRRILEKNQFDLDNTVLDVEIAHLAVELATMTTPISGIVTSIEAPVAGINVTPATSRITISSPQEIYFEAAVDENDIGQVKLGQKAQVLLDAYEEEFSGVVKEISFVSVKTSGGGTAFPTKIFLDSANNDEKFKLGMNGDVEILIQEKENVLYLPAEAVKTKNGQSYVEVLTNGQLKQIEIQTGLETDADVEITAGLDENQEVVLAEKKE